MRLLKLSKAEWSELIAGWIEGFITTALIMTLVMMTLGIELYVAMIPVILMVCTGVAATVICLAIIFGRRHKHEKH